VYTYISYLHLLL